MKHRAGMGGIYTGFTVAALGVFAMVLPFLADADMMAWGYGTVVAGFMVTVTGVTTLLLYLHRRKVLLRMLNGREVLARWAYAPEEWRAMQRDELQSNKGMPLFGAILGGIFVLIGLGFFISDPDDMGLMLAIMAGIGILIAGSAWLSTALRNRAVRKDPGEVIITRGGAYFQGALTDWNAVTSKFEFAQLEKKDGNARLVITYRQLAGRYARMQHCQITIPVPQSCEQQAHDAANKLNAQPY